MFPGECSRRLPLGEVHAVECLGIFRTDSPLHAMGENFAVSQR